MTKKTAFFSPRTDLAIDIHEILTEDSGSEPDGLESNFEKKDGVEVFTLKVLNESGVKKAGKPIGSYVTVSTGRIWTYDNDRFLKVCSVVSDEIKKFLPSGKTFLIAGLGNREIIADAIGAEVAAYTIVTRHIKQNSPSLFNSFDMCETAYITPGVLGNTGVEAAEIIKGVADDIHPDCIIAIDSLSSRRISRLATTVQICNTGIAPGSGVANSRHSINRESMGVPVIAIGIPTVVDAATLAVDILNEADKFGVFNGQIPESSAIHSILESSNLNFYVTPKESDIIIKNSAKLLGFALNRAIHKNLSFEDMADFL